MIYLKSLIALRQNIKDDLYESSFKDEMGLVDIPQNVWAKAFRHDESKSLTIVFLDRRINKDTMTLKVDTSCLDVANLSKATLYTLNGMEIELEIIHNDKGIVSIQVPEREGDPAAVMLR